MEQCKMLYSMQCNKDLFALAFDEEEEEEEKERYSNLVNGMADSILRGQGYLVQLQQLLKIQYLNN